MNQHREQDVGDPEKAPAPGKRDQVPAPPGLLGRVGRAVVSSSASFRTRCAPGASSQAPRSPHRESRESEFLEGCLPKHVRGHIGHRLGAGMVGDQQSATAASVVS